jgi:hypothetical protein
MFYENYLNSIKSDMSFIPESASFKDAGIFTERSIQDAFNEAFIGLAMDEMTMFESALNEADGDVESKKASPEKKREILATIKKFFSTVWGKIKGFFMTIIDKVKEMYTKFTREKGKTIAEDFKKSLKSLKGSDITVSLYDVSTPGKIKTGSKADFDKIFSLAAAAKKDPEGAISKDEVDELLKDIRKSVDEIKPNDKAGYSDIFKAESAIINYSLKANSMIDDIKNNYNFAKKFIDKSMNDAKDIVNKGDDVKLFIKIVSKLSSCITSVESAYINKAKQVRSNYVAVMAKVIVKGKRITNEDTEITIDVQENPDEDTKVDVKTEPEESSGVEDEVEEAFNALLEEDDVKAAEDSAEGDKVDDEAAPEAVKEENEADSEISDDDMVEESTDLYRALVSYLD